MTNGFKPVVEASDSLRPSLANGNAESSPFEKQESMTSGTHEKNLQSNQRPKQYASLIDHLTRLAITELLKTLETAFDGIDDLLFELANSARNNTEQSRLFDAMREIRLKRKNFEQFFEGAIKKLFKNPALKVTIDTPIADSSQLSLVQNEELEVQVIIESGIAALKADNIGEILQLQARYANLLGITPNNQSTSPLDPDNLCKLLAKGCSYLELDKHDQLMTLKQLNKALTLCYPNLLASLNKELVAQGILPGLKFKSSTEVSAPEKSAAPQAPHADSSSPTTKTRNSIAQTGDDHDLLQEMKSLLGEMRNRLSSRADHGSPQATYLAGDTYNPDELIDILDEVQEAVLPSELSVGAAKILDLRKVLASRHPEKGEEHKSVSENDEDLINLVSMLFEFILDDYNLSAPIQVLISRLQIPILKVVIRDQTFFSKSTHPARKLLNTLAKAGIGWNEDNEKRKDKLYSQINSIVKRILDEFDGNISLFQELYDEFQHFMERESKRSAIIEARTKEAEIGRIRSQRAQSAVKQILKALTQGASLPPAALELLQNGWSRVMFLAYLKDDAEGHWKDTVHTAELLVWSLEPHAESEEREEWKRIVPTLIKKLKAGLTEISYNAANLNHQIEELKLALTDRFKNPDSFRKEQASSLRGALTELQERQESQRAPAPSEAHSRIRNLKVGDWIEISLMNGNKFRCKLSAIIEDADCFIFVNRMGLKVLEKSASELVAELEASNIAILQQGLMMDRALDAVVGNLRRMSAKRA